jgi:hypothetical protein
MAFKILKNNTEGTDPTTGRRVMRVEMVVDTVEELPAVDGLDGVLLSQGSVALVVNASSVYVLNSEGVWKEQGV